jgi:hypothetical protein
MGEWTNDAWKAHRDSLHAWEDAWRDANGIRRPTGVSCRLCYAPVGIADDHEQTAHPEWWAMFVAGPSITEMADLMHEGHDHYPRPCPCLCGCGNTVSCVEMLGPNCNDCDMADLRGHNHPGERLP